MVKMFDFVLKAIPLSPQEYIVKVPGLISEAFELSRVIVNGLKMNKCPQDIGNNLKTILENHAKSTGSEAEIRESLPQFLQFSGEKSKRKFKLTLACLMSINEGVLPMAIDNAIEDYFGASEKRLELFKEMLRLDTQITQLKIDEQATQRNLEDIMEASRPRSSDLDYLQVQFYSTELLIIETMMGWCRVHEFQYLKSFDMETKIKSILRQDALLSGLTFRKLFHSWMKLSNELKRWILGMKKWYRSQGSFSKATLHFVIKEHHLQSEKTV
jgi:predicted XRE-type DNA-binding protein